MKIYALRDRLIDYFQQPFVGPDNKNVLAAVARTVNQPEMNSDIAQAPHHFEVWQLGEIDEQGHINVKRELIADCASLIRPGLRQGPYGEGAGAPETARPVPQEPGRARPPGGAPGGALPSQAPDPESPTGEIRRGPQGGYPPRDGHRHPGN